MCCLSLLRSWLWEKGWSPSLQNQACISQNVLQGPVSRDGLVLLPANYNGEERNSKTAQVERLCPWERLKGEPFSTYIKPKYKTAIGIHSWSKSSVRNSSWLPQFPLEVSAGCCKCQIWWCIYLRLFVLSLGSRTGGNTALPRCPSIQNSSWLPQLVFPVISVNVYKPSTDGVLLFVSLAIYSFTLACSVLNKLIKKKQQNKQTTTKNRHGAYTFNIRT